MKHVLTTAISCVILAIQARAADTNPSATCAPPPGFVDSPHPAVAPSEKLVSHTEEAIIDRPFRVVAKAMDNTGDQSGRRARIPDIRPTGSLPGAAAVHVLTPGGWGAPGSRRIVCLTDGGTTHEEVLEQEGNWRGSDSPVSWSRFRYIVWNYTTPKARPVEYGVGEFRVMQIDEMHTRVAWTYSFKLRENVFPGSLASLGRWLFRVWYLDGDYARMMRATLGRRKVDAERQPAPAS